MKKLLKILICVCLAGTIVLSSVASYSAKLYTGGAANRFKDSDEVIKTVTDLFVNNQEKVYENVLKLYGISEDYIHAPLYSHCELYSKAFQRLLIDNGIYVQARTNATFSGYHYCGSHCYDMLIADLSDGTKKFFVVDTTYRQFLRDYFRNKISAENVTDAEIDDAILKSGLPEVLIFELNDRDTAKKQIEEILNDTSSVATDFLATEYETQSYPEPDLQLTSDSLLTSEDKLRLENGEAVNKPYGDLFFSGSFDNWQQERQFLYVGNGVYEAYLSLNSDVSDYKIEIKDSAHNTLFGINDALTVMCTSPLMYLMSTPQFFLNKSAPGDISINTNSCTDITIRIDSRAGTDNPLIRVLPSQYTYGVFGDVSKNDGICTLKDEVMLQSYLNDSIDLDSTSLSLANVNGDNKISIADVMYMSNYIAEIYSTDNLTGFDCKRSLEPYSMIGK